MIPIKFYDPWILFWGLMWNIAGWLGFSFGRFAPWIFSQAIGCKRKRIS